jgi:hypothetical protein
MWGSNALRLSMHLLLRLLLFFHAATATARADKSNGKEQGVEKWRELLPTLAAQRQRVGRWGTRRFLFLHHFFNIIFLMRNTTLRSAKAFGATMDG